MLKYNYIFMYSAVFCVHFINMCYASSENKDIYKYVYLINLNCGLNYFNFLHI